MIDVNAMMSLFREEIVVLDMASPYVILGKLTGEDGSYFVLEEADVHDLRDSSTTREQYVLDSRRHGIGINRKRVFVAKADVVSLSALSDVQE
ncbi:MAG: hypothetical protein KDA80_04110 [Planctomycetaceae bacterium]|nr:hypothetical protein [Planctomycetaceae bacterium]